MRLDLVDGNVYRPPMVRVGVVCLWLVLGGCGSVQPANDPDAGVPDDPDAGVPDASPDSGPDTPMSESLSIVTQTRFASATGARVGAAQDGVEVVSLEADGTFVQQAKTDSSGRTSLQVYPGGSVTAIYRHVADSGTDLVTYFGVKPNDTLTFGQRFSPGASNVVGTMTFTYPVFTGVTLYQVFAPCESGFAVAGTQQITLTELESCHKDPMDVVFLALDADGRVLAYNFITVPFASSTSASIGSWLSPKTAMVNVTGLPAEIQGLNSIWANVGNVEQRMFQFFLSGQITGGAFTTSFAWAPTAVRTEAHLVLSRSGNFQPMHIIDALQSSAINLTVASPALPPWLESSSASTAAGTATMQLVGSGTYDAAVFQLSWTTRVGSVDIPSSWTFILPPQMTSFSFPPLPAQLASILPQPEDEFTWQARIIELPAVSSYDQVRAIPEKSLVCPGSLVPDCAVRSGEFQRIIYE